MIPIDSPHNEAFGHWVFESTILIPSIEKGNKIVLTTRKKYKKLFCDYFGFDESQVEYDSTKLAKSSFSMMDNPVPEEYPPLLERLFSHFSSSVKPDVDFVVLPRQKKDNYSKNDRDCPIAPFLDVFRTSGRTYRIVNTDEIDSLQTQIDLVNSGKNVVVVDGSASQVNGMFCSGKNIYVVSCNLLENQTKQYPMLQLVQDQIRKKNTITFIDGNQLKDVICLGDKL